MPRAGTINLRPTIYSFKTVWRFSAPIEQVWDILWAVDHWPSWWSGLTSVQLIQPGTGPDGLGTVRRFAWKTKLGYRLVVDLKLIQVERLHRIESRASGDLEGTGIWTLTPEGNETIVQYDWNVSTTKRWMNWLAPVARPLFNWNHDEVMQAGEDGLRVYLRR